MKNKLIIISLFLYQNLAFAERGVQVDIDGFIGSFSQTVIRAGNAISAAGFVLVCIGLMIPGFREYTKRALPWTVAGIVGIIVATRYWN